MPQLLAARYQLLKLFMERETSVLWKALDTRSQKNVMLKFPLPPDGQTACARIKSEARAYQLLKGVAGLADFVGYEENEGHPMGPFFAMEFLEGNTLYKHLREGAFPESKAITVGRALCKVLEKIHARRVIHRDISINNVFLLEKTEEVRLIDFGLALVPNEVGVYDSYDIGRVGTLTTRAPEISTAFPGDARSDIFSMGQLLHQAVNGLHNKAAQNMQGLDPNAVSRVSKPLSKIFAHCVEAPNARYQSAKELDSALRALQLKRIAVPTSSVLGVILLVGAGYSYVNQAKTTVTPQPAAPTTAPSNAIVAPVATQPTTTPNTALATKEENTTSGKTPKKLKTSGEKQPTKEPPKEEEYQVSDELKAYVTQPLPTAKPRPIEVRNGIKNK
jgi:serine/threonine protein kinase